MLVSCLSNISLSDMMRYFSERSSKKLQEEFYKLKKKILGTPYMGAGIFCSTVGIVAETMITDYLEKQDDNFDEIFKIVK